MADFWTLATSNSGALLGWFAETTLVASALATMAALVARIPRLAPSPAARHALWLLVMIKLVTPPLVHWPWSVPSPVATTRHDSRPMTDDFACLVDDGPTPVDFEVSGDAPVASGLPYVATVSASSAEVSAPPGSGAWVVLAWLTGSVALAVGQARRVVRFRRLLLGAVPAPGWLTEEAERVGRRLAVRVPAILVVPRLGTPVLWCLGRPVLLVPALLLKTLEAGRWRAIVAHELAHLRRGDHWVRRLELAAGLAWWWNPLYWLARHRLDFEAELACDAWAVWASPRDRVTYAESLIRICTSLSPADSPSPALGVAGTGHSFERRLTMILRDRVDRRVSAPGLLAASMLAALALPSWTLAGDPPVDPPPAPVAAPPELVVEVVSVDEPDDDDDDATEQEQSKSKAKAAKLKAEHAALREKHEAMAKEMEAKFGPTSDFAKRLEAWAKEIESKFGAGSDFAKQMEAIGAEIELKIETGTGSAKELELKFGPNSDAARKVKEVMEKVRGKVPAPGGAQSPAQSKKSKMRIELKAEAEADKAQALADKAMSDALKLKMKAEARAKADDRARPGASADRRDRRIEALESRIDSLKEELDKLKAEAKSGDEDGEN